MAIFDEKDRDQISELFRTKEVAKIDPDNQNFEKPNTKIKKPLYETPKTKEISHDEVKGFKSKTKSVDYEKPSDYEADTESVQMIIPNELKLETKQGEVHDPEYEGLDSSSGIVLAPEGYSSSEKSVIVEPTEGLNNSQPFVVAEPGEDASNYENKTGIVKQNPNPSETKTSLIVSETPTGYKSKDNTVVAERTSNWNQKEYENYTEGESSVLGIGRQTPYLQNPDYQGSESKAGLVGISGPNLKSEFYEWLSKGGMLRGNTNLDNYGGSFKEVLDQLSSNFGGTGIRDTFTELDRQYQNFDNLVKAWKESGFKGAVTQLFKNMNDNTATPIQSEAIVPAINNLIDSIPIISLFTKQKYSLELNRKTYKSEEIYNKAVSYRAEALKIYEGGMYGLYWYAKFYANHGIPTDMQPLILGRLTGNPEYSRPTPRIFNDGVKDYISTIGDAYDSARPAEYVNLMDFTTTDMVNPFKQVFAKKRTIPVVNKDTGIVEKMKIVDTPMKQTQYKRTDNPKGVLHEHDAVIRFDQISPKFNNGLVRKVKTKVVDSSNTPNHLTESSRDKTMFRGWSEYEIETMSSGLKTTAGAVYVDPKMWGEFEQLESGIKINSLQEYIKYQQDLSTKLNDVSNKEMKYGDIYYGYYPYKWSQVFENFEISSNGNWNVALSEFTGDLAPWSMFVPKNRPTYGKWHYMPIIGYEFMDKDLNSTSIAVSESLNLQIPNAQQFVSTLQMTFIDDRYDRIFNWFAAYMNSIYGPFDTYVKPYKNCCLRCVIDILDWDRTILKRMKYAIIPSHFTQQYIGEADHSYKTVSVTFSVVGEIPEKDWKPQ